MKNNIAFWSQNKPINKKGFITEMMTRNGIAYYRQKKIEIVPTLHNRLSAERNERLKWKFIFWVLLICFISVVISLWILRNRLIEGIEYINPVSNTDISGVRFTEKELREFFEKNKQEMPNNHEWLIQPEFHFIEKAQAKTEKDVSPNNEIDMLILEVFGANQYDTAKCIMKHESGQNPSRENRGTARGNYKGECSIGLFQINLASNGCMGRAVHWNKAEGKTLKEKVEWLKVPENNVKVAKQIFNASYWNPWSTYKKCRLLNGI